MKEGSVVFKLSGYFNPALKISFKAVLVLVVLLWAGNIRAQTGKSVNGRVLDESQKPLANVSVNLKGSSEVVSTNEQGNFSIAGVSDSAVLVFSHIGRLTQEVPVAGKTDFNIVLEPDQTGLEEVVVTGYGTQRKADLTGAISSVEPKKLQSVVARSADQALQGLASGVDVTNNGVPGQPSKIRVRGITSFGDSQPLVIVDGIEQPLNQIPAQDIESMQVLKDGRSAAIYGVRGSNGVILVTTKKGKTGKPRVTYNGYGGVIFPLKGNVYNMMNAEEYMRFTNEVDPNNPLFVNGMPDYTYRGPKGSGVGFEGDSQVDPSLYFREDPNRGNNYIIQKVNKAGTDWIGEAFNKAGFTEHNLSVNGGSDAARYFFGLGYLDEQGTLQTIYSKRYSLRVNTDFKIGKIFKVGENLNVYYRDYLPFGTGSEFGGLAALYKLNPLIPVKDIKGNWAGTWAGPQLGSDVNTIGNLNRAAKNSRYINYAVIGNVFAEINFMKNLVGRTSVGFNLQNYFQQIWTGAQAEAAEASATLNRLANSSSISRQMTYTNTLEYKGKFGKHSVAALVGTEAITMDARNLLGQIDNFFTDDYNFLTLNNGNQGLIAQSGLDKSALFSIFGRVDYNYADKYLLGVTVRRDGSSRFGPDNRYGVFPSFSAGWRLSREKFLENVSWLDDLRLRGSYGVLGSQNNVDVLNQYSLYYRSRAYTDYDITGSGNAIVEGYGKSRLGNPYTGWEENTVSNIGLDLSVLNSLDIQVDLYKKAIKGLLFTEPLPLVIAPSGITPPTINIGNIQNTGVDASVTYRLKPIGEKLNIAIGSNITTYKNKIVKLPEPGYFLNGGLGGFGDYSRNQIGHPMGAFYGFKVLGLFNSDEDIANHATQEDAEPGRFKFLDYNNDGEITEDDRHFLGSPHPKFTYGLTLNVDYLGFDLMAHFYGVSGNMINNAAKAITEFYQYYPTTNKSRALLNAWTPTNTNTTVPKVERSASFSTTSYFSSYFLENGSYFRLRTVSLGYRLDPSKNYMRKLGLSNLRIYAQGANLFTVTKYSGPDPEIATGSNSSWGVDISTYPANEPRLTLGVTATF